MAINFLEIITPNFLSASAASLGLLISSVRLISLTGNLKFSNPRSRLIEWGLDNDGRKSYAKKISEEEIYIPHFASTTVYLRNSETDDYDNFRVSDWRPSMRNGGIQNFEATHHKSSLVKLDPQNEIKTFSFLGGVIMAIFTQLSQE